MPLFLHSDFVAESSRQRARAHIHRSLKGKLREAVRRHSTHVKYPTWTMRSVIGAKCFSLKVYIDTPKLYQNTYWIFFSCDDFVKQWLALGRYGYFVDVVALRHDTVSPKDAIQNKGSKIQTTVRSAIAATNPNGCSTMMMQSSFPANSPMHCH